MSGVLYIVPTPIGNLGDMTPRAVEVLKQASLILAEDTRTSLPLLRHFEIQTSLSSHHKFNEHNEVAKIIERLKEGQDVALISDAGTPAISDPGYLLSHHCRENDIKVVTLPGATAFVPALVNSGLPCERFVFQGFLPIKKGRATRLQEIGDSNLTNIIYESPVRLVRTLTQLAEVCGEDREASVSREISKKFEETCRGTLQKLIAHYKSQTPKGEIIIVIAPKPEIKVREHKNKFKD